MENDMLSSLLSDPEALQNAMKTVSDLLGGQPSAQTEPQNAYDPASEMMQKALPVIGAIAQSGQHAVKPEKRASAGCPAGYGYYDRLAHRVVPADGR